MSKEINIEEMHISIPFYNWIEGDSEIVNEMLKAGYPNSNALERIKRFMILDFLTNNHNYNDEEFQKILKNYKKEKRKEEDRNLENTESDSCANDDDDFPF